MTVVQPQRLSVFRNGLRKARRQLAFTLALVLSTAGIIYLETIDAEGRIRDHVTAEIAAGADSDGRSPALDQALRSTIERSVTRYTAAPELAETQAPLLLAAALGIAHEIGDAKSHHRRVEEVLARLEREPSLRTEELGAALALIAGALPQLEARALALLPPA